METKTHKPIPRFNDHGVGCKGHGNFMLDSTLENEGDREVVIKAVDNAIKSIEIKIKEDEFNKTNTTKAQE